jgi:hypothetical protein
LYLSAYYEHPYPHPKGKESPIPIFCIRKLILCKRIKNSSVCKYRSKEKTAGGYLWVIKVRHWKR